MTIHTQVFFVCLFLFFTAIPVTYGSSWASGRIRAAAEAYATATATLDVSCICDLCHHLQQGQILNPLREARDQIHIHMDIMLRP